VPVTLQFAGNRTNDHANNVIDAVPVTLQFAGNRT